MKIFLLLTFIVTSISAESSCVSSFKKLLHASREETMVSGNVRMIGPIETESRHATEVYTTVVDKKNHAIFKPNMPDMNASNSGHEVAAYLLSEELGLDFVPITVERVVDGRLGSLQLMVTNSETATKRAGYFFYADHLTGLRSNKLNFWDYLIVNIDRHSDNFLFDKWNKLWAIDHGACFMLNTSNFKKIDRLFGGGMETLRVSDKIIKRLNALSDEKIRTLLGNYLSEKKLRNLIGRRDAYLQEFAP